MGWVAAGKATAPETRGITISIFGHSFEFVSGEKIKGNGQLTETDLNRIYRRKKNRKKTVLATRKPGRERSCTTCRGDQDRERNEKKKSQERGKIPQRHE